MTIFLLIIDKNLLMNILPINILPINVLAEIISSLEVNDIKNLIKNDRIWQDAFNFAVIHNMCMCAYSDTPITHDIFLSEEAYNYDFYPLEYEDTKNIEGTLYLNLQMLNLNTIGII